MLMYKLTQAPMFCDTVLPRLYPSLDYYPVALFCYSFSKLDGFLISRWTNRLKQNSDELQQTNGKFLAKI